MVIETRDGRVPNGFLADQDAQVVMLRGLDGADVACGAQKLSPWNPAGRSLMPDGLLVGGGRIRRFATSSHTRWRSPAHHAVKGPQTMVSPPPGPVIRAGVAPREEPSQSDSASEQVLDDELIEILVIQVRDQSLASFSG